MKYIIFWIGCMEVPFLFADIVQHDDVAKVVNRPVISAGYVMIKDGKAFCYGSSISLEIKARNWDSEIVQLYFDNPLMTAIDFKNLPARPTAA